MLKKFLAATVALFCLLTPAVAFAYNPLDAACNSGSNVKQTSTTCSPDGKSNPIAGPNGALKKISIVLAVISGVIAVIIIIIAGLQMVLSNGDTQKVAKARSAVLGSVIGLLIIIGAETIILFVVNKL